MYKKDILVYPNDTWTKKSSVFISNLIIRNSFDKKEANIMLTGGRSASSIYLKINRQLFKKYKLNIFLTDERNVSIKNKNSNYKNVLLNLFDDKIDGGAKFEPIIYPKKTLSENLIHYSKKIPSKLDILLLTLGDDGHIASLFPNTKDILENKRKMIITTEPNKHKLRISITRKVIKNAKHIVVLVPGNKKGKILSEMKKNREIPANIIIKANWLLNQSAYDEYIKD